MADISESKQNRAEQKEAKDNAATTPKFCLMIGFGELSETEIDLDLYCCDNKEFISISVKGGAINDYLSQLQKAGLISFDKNELSADCISGKEKALLETLQKDKTAHNVILGSRFEHYYDKVTGKGAPQTLTTIKSNEELKNMRSNNNS